MTIAAGFLCADGVVVCADTELTLHTMKGTGLKLEWVRHKSVKVVFGGAGDAHMMRIVQQECRKSIPEGATMDDAEDAIRRVIKDVHQEHIFPVSADVNLRPNVEMVFGIWGSGCRECRLLQTRLTAAANEQVSLLGMGYEFARAVCDRVLGPPYRITVLEAVFASMRMLDEVKNYVQGCGGESDIVALMNDGRIVPFFREDLRGLGDAITELEASIRDATFAAVNAAATADARFQDIKTSMDALASHPTVLEMRRKIAEFTA